MDERLEANRRRWDESADLHYAGAAYDVPGFLAGRDTLDPLEREGLEPVAGKRLLHLQCHFGLDSLSWARRGARVTGADFSGRAVELARGLAAETGLDARFIQSAIPGLPPELTGDFDIVFASHGVLIWQPELAPWLAEAARCLAPGGVLKLVDSHPLSMVLEDEAQQPAYAVRYPYFSGEAQRFEDSGTYASPGPLTNRTSYEWSHPLEEIIQGVLAAGLVLESFREYPYIAWRQFPWLEKHADGFWHLPAGLIPLPLTFSLLARKSR